jgi:polar amino acid transport system substrate-binding protein
LKGNTVTHVGTSGRHATRTVAAVIAAATMALVSACGSSSKPAAGSGSAPVPAASTGSASALPTRDVVSSIHADPALRAELPAAVQSRGTLILGTVQVTGGAAGLPHAALDPSGKAVGLDIDVMDAIAKKLGVTWDTQYGTFQTIIPGVQNGKYDVGEGDFGATKAREQVVDFATYLNDGQGFLGAKDLTVNKISTLTDLCGLNVATSPGTTFQQILTAGAGKCAAAGKSPYNVQYFSDTAPIVLGLANGKIDVYFGPVLSLRYEALHIPNTKFLGQISTTPVGFVTAKGSPDAKAISDAINSLIASGDYAKIFAKWGVPDTAVTSSVLNPTPTF